MYYKLFGMIGIAETEAGEFWEIYKLDVVVIPTNKLIIRNDKEDLVWCNFGIFLSDIYTTFTRRFFSLSDLLS